MNSLTEYYVDHDLSACNTADVQRVCEETRKAIDELSQEAKEGEIIKHIEQGNYLDYLVVDVIKGNYGHWFIFGKGAVFTESRIPLL